MGRIETDAWMNRLAYHVRSRLAFQGARRTRGGGQPALQDLRASVYPAVMVGLAAGLANALGFLFFLPHLFDSTAEFLNWSCRLVGWYVIVCLAASTSVT